MKQMFTLAVAFLSFAATTKAAPAKEQTASFSFAIPAVVTSVSVTNGIHVILVEDPSSDIKVEGEDKYVARVAYSVENGTLTIKSKKGSLKNKVTVTVPVNSLRSVIVDGEASVSCKGWLESNLITIIMKGMGNVKLLNKGEIAFESDEDIDMMVQKWHPSDSSAIK